MKTLTHSNSIRTALPLALVCAMAAASSAAATDYNIRLAATGLDHPTGIVAAGPRTLVITQLPTPGIPGPAGGRNTVDMIQLHPDLARNRIVNLTAGEPEPTNLAFDKHGALYWTCKSAGVILKRAQNGTVGLFLGGLDHPSGIAVDRWDEVYFTQLPTPGIPGPAGGLNTVSVTDGASVQILTLGEPEPTDIAVARDGTAYWTCKSAGVILRRNVAGVVSLVLKDLMKPVGIAVDHPGGRLYFTEVPTPAVPGSAGGMNKVSVLDLTTGGLKIIHEGDPEPTDVAVAPNGALFWTCTSAGVIVEARER